MKNQQHYLPCHDCPWRRKAIRGWLGKEKADVWMARAMGETWTECHTHADCQCAGMAIFRANVCKMPRYPVILVLKPNHELVFSSPQQFFDHHNLNKAIQDLRNEKKKQKSKYIFRS
jgi:hypothetical protein